MMYVPEAAASYGPKWAMVLNEPVSKHGSEVADRLVMTSAEQCSDLDQETARMRASGRVLRLQGEDHGKARREAGAPIDGIGAECSWHRYWRGGDLRCGTTLLPSRLIVTNAANFVFQSAVTEVIG